jgi:CrcB protein
MPISRLALAAVSAGGVLGAEARYGLTLALPRHTGQFPWSTLLINLTGSLLIGVLMAWLGRQPVPRPVLRAFLGIGILGGYTTYSTFAVDVQQLLLAHRPLTALGYLAATVLGCAAAVWLATTVTVMTSEPGLPDTEPALPEAETR